MNTQKNIHVNGANLKEVRKHLRSLLKAGALQARQTYYDYYDSCHAPSETPNAEFKNAMELLKADDLKAGGMAISIVPGAGIYVLYTSYKTLEVKVGAK